MKTGGCRGPVANRIQTQAQHYKIFWVPKGSRNIDLVHEIWFLNISNQFKHSKKHTSYKIGMYGKPLMGLLIWVRREEIGFDLTKSLTKCYPWTSLVASWCSIFTSKIGMESDYPTHLSLTLQGQRKKASRWLTRTRTTHQAGMTSTPFLVRSQQPKSGHQRPDLPSAVPEDPRGSF
jgi:hypothetical protein